MEAAPKDQEPTTNQWLVDPELFDPSNRPGCDVLRLRGTKGAMACGAVEGRRRVVEVDSGGWPAVEGRTACGGGWLGRGLWSPWTAGRRVVWLAGWDPRESREDARDERTTACATAGTPGESRTALG